MKRLLAGVALCAVAVLAGCSSAAASDGAVSQERLTDALVVQDTPQGQEPVSELVFYQSIQDDPEAMANLLGLLPNGEEVSAFSLADPDFALEIPAQQQEDLEAALEAVGPQASFVVVDAQTGWGISCGAQTPSYAASSSKAWFALFLCQQAEEGHISLDQEIYGYTDYPLALVEDWQNPNCVGAYMENAVLYSDNGAYETLREAFDWQGYNQWLADLRLELGYFDEKYWYPDFSPATSVQLWMNLYAYLQSDAPNASWLGRLLANTTVSYLREGFEAAGYGAAVMDKAGWDAGSTCDSGVVQVNGRTYFAAVFTTLDMGDESAQLVEELSVAAIEAVMALQAAA